MNDWKEIAVDDILKEVEEISEKGRKELEYKQENTNGLKCVGTRTVEKKFCCTTTIPAGFTITTAGKVAWKNCLKCVKVFEKVDVFCDGGNKCGEVDACVLKIVGCIPLIASAPITGESSSTSNVCCCCCLCVDECVKCWPIQSNCDCDWDSNPPCSAERAVSIALKDNVVNVCTNYCDPDCNPNTSNSNPDCINVTISGTLQLSCIAPSSRDK